MINICGIGSLENRNVGLWDSDSDSEAWITKKMLKSLIFPLFSTKLQFLKLSDFSLENNCEEGLFRLGFLRFFSKLMYGTVQF